MPDTQSMPSPSDYDHEIIAKIANNLGESTSHTDPAQAKKANAARAIINKIIGIEAVLADTGYFTPQALTDAETITWDADGGYNATVTITDDRTLDAIANAPAGSSGMLWLTQDGTGSHGITLDASQTPLIGAAADIASMSADETAVVHWNTPDGTNFFLEIHTP